MQVDSLLKTERKASQNYSEVPPVRMAITKKSKIKSAEKDVDKRELLLYC